MKYNPFRVLICLFALGMAVGCGSMGQKGDTEAVQTEPKILKLAGKIDNKYPVHMIIDLDNLTGAYYYEKSGVDHCLSLKIGSYNEASGQLTANEYNDKGQLTGEFSGTVSDKGFVGNATFGSKTMPFDIAVCNDPEALFPKLAATSDGSSQNMAAETKKDESTEDLSSKTIVIKTQYKDSSVTFLFVCDYTIEIKPNGLYNVKTVEKSGFRNTSYEDYEFNNPSKDEYSGSWQIYSAIKVGREYPDFYCLNRSDHSDIWISPDLKYIWWGEDIMTRQHMISKRQRGRRV